VSSGPTALGHGGGGALHLGGGAWPSAAVLRERDTTTGVGRRSALGRARPRALSFIAGRDGGRGRRCSMASHQWPKGRRRLKAFKGRRDGEGVTEGEVKKGRGGRCFTAP
jgi:hypothetical protein